MSALNSSSGASTDSNEIVSPEGVSLSYEELFDNKTTEIPCYLPDKAEIDCQTSNHKDKTTEERDSGSDIIITETQTSNDSYLTDKNDESGLHSENSMAEVNEESGLLTENSVPETNKEVSLLSENSAPEINSLFITDSHAECPDILEQTSKHTEVHEDYKDDLSSESNPDTTDASEETEQLQEPHQLATSSKHNVTDIIEQMPEAKLKAEGSDENGLFSGRPRELPEISAEPGCSEGAQVSESKPQTEGRGGNGFIAGYQRESSEISSEPGDYECSNEISLAEENGPCSKDQRVKQHQNEDDGSASWRKHKKHFFILSNAGKPIFSRYGDEHKLAGFSATLQAIISFVENSGDRIRYVRAGDHQVVFLVKGPIYLVSISSTDEPYHSLKGQLELLYGQLLLILTKSVEKCFTKNANFDLQPLLGGTETVFSSLIQSFSWNPASFLHSYTCLPLSNTARQAAGAALHDVADSDLLFALLLSNSKVISLVGSQKAALHPDDIFLLSNFVSSSESFRTTESFSPICLPHFNPMAFLYAYISYLNTETCLILITKNSNAFFHLKESRARVENFLIETDVLREIGNSVARGGLRVEDLPGAFVRSQEKGKDADNQASTSLRAGVGGSSGLLHFMYRSVYLEQYVASEFSLPLQKRDSQKRLFRAYETLYASIHGAPAGPHQMQYRRDENHVLLAWSTADFEFFAAFDPLAEKSSAITVCNRVCQWIRDLENDIFYVGASPFNW